MQHSNADSGPQVSIAYQWPEKMECKADGVKISTSFGYEVKTTDNRRTASIHESVALRVRDFGQATAREIDERFATPLTRLLKYVTNGESKVERYQVSLVVTDDEKSERDTTVDRLFSPVGAKVKKELMPHHLLFSLGDVAERFEPFMQAWFDFQKSHRDFANIFFSYEYTSHTFTEMRFLFLILALQCYLREDVQNEDQAIVEGIDKARKEFLKASSLKDSLAALILPSAVEIAFPKLMDRMLADDWAYAEKIVGTDSAQFVEVLLCTWDYVTRRDKPGANVAKGANLFWLSERISALVKLRILKHLDFSDEKIIEIRDRNPALNHLVHLKAPWDSLSSEED